MTEALPAARESLPLGRGAPDLDALAESGAGPGANLPSEPGAGRPETEVGSYDGEVDLGPLKRVARHLPDGDPARRLIEGEPDSLPFPVLAAKADSWVLLLLRRED